MATRRVSESANQRVGEPGGGRGPVLVLVVMMAAFALFFGALAVQQHRVFLTNGLDVGNVDQALWNTAQGRFLHFTLMAPVESRLALHVEPILLLFVPVYWLGLGGPPLLLAVQAGVVALGAWPLYQLAVRKYQLSKRTTNDERRTTSDPPHSPMFLRESPAMVRWALLAIPAAYLLLPTLESAVLYDFHAVTLAPTLLLFAFLALERRHTGRLWLFLALAMACKEDMPLVVAMIGLYAGLAQRRWRLAAAIISAAALWFVTAVGVIQPAFSVAGNVQLDRYAWLGDSLPAMAQTLLTQPALVLAHLWQQADLPAYLLRLLFPTAFLALFSPLTLLPTLPTLAVNLLSDNPFTWRLEDFHYGAPLAPFLFISAAYGVIHLAGWLARLAAKNETPHPSSLAARPSSLVALLLLLLTFSGVYHLHRGYTPLARPFAWPAYTAHHRQLDQILTTVPDDAPLFAQSNLAPHLSQRAVIYSDFGFFTDPDFPAQAEVQAVLLDVTSLANSGGLHQFLQQTLLAGGDYQLAAATDGILHLRRSDTPASTVTLPPDFFSFTRPAGPPEFALPADFGEAVRLRGFALHFNRQEEVEVTVDLEALQPLGAEQPALYLLDDRGHPLGATTDLPPALVWRPPATWQPGEVVRVRFNTLPWYTRDTAAYRLALGVGRGSDPWDVAQRLRPQVSPDTALAVRLPADNTLIELARIEQVGGMPAGGPRWRRFSRPGVPQSLAADFGGQITLFGHTQPSVTADSARVTLYWQASVAPEPLVRFVQLVGPDGQVVGQQDSAPEAGQYPTALWQPGEVVVETVEFAVQPDRPAGAYRLHVGLYRPGTGERLPLAGGGDHVEISLPAPR